MIFYSSSKAFLYLSSVFILRICSLAFYIKSGFNSNSAESLSNPSIALIYLSKAGNSFAHSGIVNLGSLPFFFFFFGANNVLMSTGFFVVGSIGFLVLKSNTTGTYLSVLSGYSLKS